MARLQQVRQRIGTTICRLIARPGRDLRTFSLLRRPSVPTPTSTRWSVPRPPWSVVVVVLITVLSLIAAGASSSSSPQQANPARNALRHAALALFATVPSPATDIHTYAGNGTAGYSGDGGPALSAEFDGTWADADDSNLNVAFPDWANSRIRIVAGTSGDWFGTSMTAGDVYTVAGDGTSGYSGNGGPATSAEIDQPYAVAFDASGNLLFTDQWNNVIRLVSAVTCTSSCAYGLSSMTPGDIYTIAGDGYDAGTEYGGYSGDGGPATSAELYLPTGLAVDKWGNVVFSDASNYRVRLVAEETCTSGCPYGLSSMTIGDIYTIAGDGTLGYAGNGSAATSANLDWVTGVAVDRSGNVVLADLYNNVIRMVAGPGCSSSCPYGLSSITSGYIYTIAGTTTAGYSGDGGAATSAEIDWPRGVAVDSSGNVVFADTNNDVIRAIAESTGTYYGVAMTSGDIYTIAGDGTAGYSGDGGPAVSATLNHPIGVATDSFGQVFVTDSNNYVVRDFGGGPQGPLSVYPQGSALGDDQFGEASGPQPACACTKADPVNLATGDYSDTVTDLSIPDAGIPLQFTRTYDAVAAQQEEQTASTAPPLGYGWADNLGMSVSYNSTSGIATVTEANGALITFQNYGVDASEPAWCPSDATSAVFCPTAPRYLATLSETSGIYTYVEDLSSPMTYTFNSAGALSEIEDANGYTLTASTYSSCPSGDTCTQWTSLPSGESSGQSLVVEQSSTSPYQLLSVFDPANTSTEFVDFAYSGTGCSTWGSGPVDLCSATTAGSLATTYTYDTGKSSPYQYDQLTMTPPSTGEVTNTYNSTGLVSEQTLTTASGTTQVTEFAYGSDPLLGTGGTTTTVSSYPLGTGSGKPVDETYDQFSNGVLVATTTAYGTSNAATTYYKRDSATLLATNAVDGDGNVTTETLADYAGPGGTESSSADATLVTDGADHTQQNAYNTDNLVWCNVGAADYLDGIRCPSSPLSSPPASGTDLGMTITVYNSAGEPTSVTDPLGNTTTYSYTTSGYGVPAGLIYCSVSPVEYGHVTCPSTYTTSPTAGATSTTYDAYGDVTGTTNPDGHTTSYTYGVSGHPGLVSVETAPDGTTTTYSYNTLGEVTEEVVAFSSYSATTVSSYDSDGRLVCQVQPYEYAAGVRCPTGAITTPTPTSDSYLGATITTYDEDGRVIQTTNPLGGITYTAYDQAGEVYCTVAPYEAASPRDVSCPSSPPSSPPTLTDDPYLGATITTYDSDGRVIQVTNPLGGITLTTYDAASNVASTTVESNNSTAAPNVITTYTYDGDAYDALGDLLSKTYSGTASGYSTPTNVSYTYNVDGSRATMADATGTTTYSYDAMSDVTSQTFSAGGGTGLTSNTISYTYYSTGQLASVVYPTYGTHTSPTVTYTYDSLGNMASETDWLGYEITFSHDGDGNLTAQDNDVSGANPNGTSGTAYTYDNADLNTGATSTLTQACGGGETFLQSFSSATGSGARNADGQVTEDYESYSGSCSSQSSYERNYSYDVGGQVVFQGSVAQGSSANNFTYNAAGFATKISSHDPQGNFDTYTQVPNSSEGVTSQTPVSGSKGSTTTYTYDSLSDLATAVVGSSTTTYSYNQLGELTSAAAALTSTYLYTGDGLEAATSYKVPSWAAAASIDGTKSLNAVSCASSSFCAAVDSNGNVVTYNGTSWAAAKSIDGTKVLHGISCPTSSFCAAVDASGNVVTYNGSSWATAKSIDGTKVLDAISCPSSSFCAAVDASGNVVTYNGSSWATATSIDGTKDLSAISCPTSSFCAAVDTSGNVVTYNGSSWTTATGIDGTKALNGVSCATATFCTAVDGSGNVLAFNGTNWSATTVTDGSNALKSVSCSSASFCVAVDADGNVLVYTGTSWASAKSIDGTKTLSSVSCASASFCVAVDTSGNDVKGTAASVTAQLTWNTNGSLPLVLSDGTNYYVYGPVGEPVEQVNVTSAPPTTNPLFLTYTPSDSSWLVTNTAGQEVSFYRYDAYGNLALGTPVSPFGYAGQYTDMSSSPSGFDNMRARFYYPQTGAFTILDPDFSSTDQEYSYAGGDPVNSVDPTGDWCVKFLSWSIDCFNGGEAPVIVCNTHRGDDEFAQEQVNNLYQDTVGLPGFFDGPVTLVSQTLAIASAGAVLLIYTDEFHGWDSLSEAEGILPGLPSWMSWVNNVRGGIVTHNFTVFAIETALNGLITHGLPWLPAQALGNILISGEPSASNFGSYVPQS